MEALNEQQVMMLRLFKDPLSSEDFLEIRRLAVKLLSKKMDKTINEWEIENKLDDKSYEELSKIHFRASN